MSDVSGGHELGERHVVVVSGAPGAGKSTLAGPLAKALGFPLLSKDVIKETIFDEIGDPALGHDVDIATLSDRPVEVYCRVAPEVAFERYATRGRGPERHRVHYLRETTFEILASTRSRWGWGRSSRSTRPHRSTSQPLQPRYAVSSPAARPEVCSPRERARTSGREVSWVRA